MLRGIIIQWVVGYGHLWSESDTIFVRWVQQLQLLFQSTIDFNFRFSNEPMYCMMCAFLCFLAFIKVLGLVIYS